MFCPADKKTYGYLFLYFSVELQLDFIMNMATKKFPEWR